MSPVIADRPIPLAVDERGVIRVGGTRVTLDALVAAFSAGATAEEIVQRYPSLDLGDVYAAIGFYLHRREEVDAYLRQQEERAILVRQQHAARFDQSGIRERLLARRARGVS